MFPGRTIRVTSAILVAIMLASFSSPTLANEDGKPKVKILNSSQVYYPSLIKRGAKYKKPAVLTSATVFDAIPEWKKIKKKKLKKTDAEYHLLLEKANEKFNKALKKVAQDSSYDIMAEVDAIKCTGCTPTDVTATLIANIPS